MIVSGSSGLGVSGVDAGLLGWRSFTLHAIILKVSALRAASALVLRRFTVVGTCVFIIGVGVGASRGVPAFKWARGQPPGGPEDSLMKTTCCSDNHSDQTTWQPLWYIPNDLLPSASLLQRPAYWQTKRTTLWKKLTLKDFFYRVVKLILQLLTRRPQYCWEGTPEKHMRKHHTDVRSAHENISLQQL